jgi:beta-galactosidase
MRGKCSIIRRAFCCVLLGGSLAVSLQAAEILPLAGEWKLRLDPKDEGVARKWYDETLTDPVRIPGSLAESGYGSKPDPRHRNTGGWTPTYGFDFADVAWFQKDVVIPANWQGKHISLLLERVHWWIQVWVDGKPVSVKHQSLSIPQVIDLSEMMAPGQHRITIRMTLGPNKHIAHSSHHFRLQAGWCGMVGECALKATDPVWIKSVQVYPDVLGKKARTVVEIGNVTAKKGEGNIEWVVSSRQLPVTKDQLPVTWDGKGGRAEFEIALGPDAKLWDEFEPNLYELKLTLKVNPEPRTPNPEPFVVRFGMREFKTKGRQFVINGRPVLMRGRTDDAIFPKTLYPAMDVAEWRRLFRTCKDWGLNHVRFHSWCPPEAAFVAADELGIYLQPEGPAFGLPTTPDQKEFVAEECRRILDTYGNHPSFVLFTGGNEWAGFDEWVQEWKQRDPRRLYSHATNGGGFRPVSDFWASMGTARVNWGRVAEHPGCLRGAYHDPLVGHINNSPPSTLVDYLDTLNGVGAPGLPVIDRPVISHETGQFNAYPNYGEIAKGSNAAVRLLNYEVFREGLAARHMLDQAPDFVRASGELQVLLYREEIEAILRTPGIGGFQLLDLQDYPGQGTAVCGILDTFMESKGYGNPDEFRRWCAPVVPLLRMKQYTWTTAEPFSAEVQVAHYGPAPLDAVVRWTVGECSGVLPTKRIVPGEVASFGRFEASLPQGVYNVTLAIENTEYRNSWRIWVYQKTLPTVESDVLVTEIWDPSVELALAAGRKVLYLPKASALPRSIPGSFATDFWGFPMFKVHNPPGTMGILCDPRHPVFAAFPTEFHSNWQWWDLLKRSRAMILDDLPADFRPLVQVIDNFERNHKLGALFEAKVGPGRLAVCSMDLVSDMGQRPAARQLRHSVLRYMQSDAFNPRQELTAKVVAELGRVKSEIEGLQLAEPLGIHRASLVVAAGSKVANNKSAWAPAHDIVGTRVAGYGYSIGGDASSVRDYGVTFWRGSNMTVTITCPKRYTGNIHLHLQDIGRKNRSATLLLSGRKLGVLKGHEYGAWVVVPLAAGDTADGKVEVQVLAPAGKDVIATELVVMPTGAFDPG